MYLVQCSIVQSRWPLLRTEADLKLFHYIASVIQLRDKQSTGTAERRIAMNVELVLCPVKLDIAILRAIRLYSSLAVRILQTCLFTRGLARARLFHKLLGAVLFFIFKVILMNDETASSAWSQYLRSGLEQTCSDKTAGIKTR